MIPALSQVCTLAAPFETDVADYAAAACQNIELWLGKLEGYLQQHGLKDARRLLQRHGQNAPVASYQGGLLTSQGEARAEHWSHFRRRLEICRELGVQTLVIVADFTQPLTQPQLDGALLSLRQAAVAASQNGVRLALEFQARAPFCNNLQTALALVEQTGSPHLGICLDAFHFFTGPSKGEDLAGLSRENLFHVQLSDLSRVPRELASDADRILPGDGEWPLRELIGQLRAVGYQGYVSIELMNPALWQVPPLSFSEVALTALRHILGQARMA
jgi:4-hydroxyphenylpyruvate dioxygenase